MIIFNVILNFPVMMNFIISTILLLSLLSCTSSNIHKHHKIPIENSKFLNQTTDNNIYPRTQPQYGNYSRPLDNNAFYNKVFDNKKQLQIHDNVANKQLLQMRASTQLQQAPPTLKPMKSTSIPPVMQRKIAPQKKSLKRYYVQVGAYSRVKNIQRAQAKIQKYGKVLFEEITRGKKNITIVRLGPLPDLKTAINIQEALYKDGFSKAIIREAN
jgi:cell division protein FtsN